MHLVSRTLLLTDVVDSTKLAEELGAARVAELWTAHDRLARDLLAIHRGREIDKTDGFLLLFEEAQDAVAYALAYHRALKDLDIQARAGLHVGEVVLRENSAEDIARGAKPLEVEGVAKPTAARVMSVAQGGQTLCTAEAIEMLDLERAPHEPEGRVKGEGLVAMTHGHWMLKGVLQPQELFELGVRGEAPFVPPPDAAKAWRVQRQNEAWIPVRQVKHSLPAERDTFVGRTEDLAELAHRLDEGARLVSVLGIGGTGKTRLATHFGWAWLGSFPGGVWFCDLSEARSADGIAYAVGKALDVPLGKEPLEQLGNAIRGRGKCLVILDNFEQVARHAHLTLGPWLDRAADAQFVVTTREVLGVRGEKALALAPLATSEAARLFIARAQDAKRDFVADDGASIEALVTLLDGLPLAVELAAARVRLMSPRVLLQRMSQRFRLLTSSGGRRDRQATLRGALDWSWDLLSEDEKAALAQLSVFEGGFTLASAAAVLDLQELWPEDAVQALLDKSLVRRVADERFDLLVSVQAYAAEKLRGRGLYEATEVRHGAYFAGLGSEAALASLDVHGGVGRRIALAPELENLLAATRRAVARDAGERAAATLKAAWVLLQLRGPTGVAVDLATAALEVADLTPNTRAGLAQVLGQAQWLLGRVDEARAHYDEALKIHHELGNRALEGIVRGRLGVLSWALGQMDEARAYFTEALSIHREEGDRASEGHVLGNLGNLYWALGQMDEARAYFSKALSIHREVGNRALEGTVLGNLGVVHMDQGRNDEALTHYEEALAIGREIGSRRDEGIVLGNLGGLYRNQGRNTQARAHYEEALSIHRELGSRAFEGHVLSILGRLHQDQGQMNKARASFDAGEALLRAVEDVDELGKLLCGRALLEVAEGQGEAARAALKEAEALASELGAGTDSELGRELVVARAAVDVQ